MDREIGVWGCVPWIGLWIILVFFAPVPEKEKIKIFLVGLGIAIYGFISLAIGNSGSPDTTPIIVRLLMVVIGIFLLFAYFILSCKALFQEHQKRKALYALLGEEGWQRYSNCTIHDQVVYE